MCLTMFSVVLFDCGALIAGRSRRCKFVQPSGIADYQACSSPFHVKNLPVSLIVSLEIKLISPLMLSCRLIPAVALPVILRTQPTGMHQNI